MFRVGLPNGWYRVACASVDPGAVLPLVDQRSFKCWGQDTVFAGPEHGAPLAVAGMTLVEGDDIVEVTDDRLRVVVGDPAYAGWTWRRSLPGSRRGGRVRGLMRHGTQPPHDVIARRLERPGLDGMPLRPWIEREIPPDAVILATDRRRATCSSGPSCPS